LQEANHEAPSLAEVFDFALEAFLFAEQLRSLFALVSEFFGELLVLLLEVDGLLLERLLALFLALAESPLRLAVLHSALDLFGTHVSVLVRD
jgi:hypothetical protein